MARILVVEDEDELADNLEIILSRENYTVEVATDGTLGDQMLEHYQYDLVILDWRLPGVQGIEICRRFRLRGGATPILFLTAEKDVLAKEKGLDSGADDYLTKPFHPVELLARVRALLRRVPAFSGDALTLGALSLDFKRHKVTLSDREIRLLPLEFTLLEFLMRNPGQVFSQETLLERVWPPGSDASVETVRTYIKTLRKKIESDAGPALKNVHGVGYKLEA